jgi:hypothetical protein
MLLGLFASGWIFFEKSQSPVDGFEQEEFLPGETV